MFLQPSAVFFLPLLYHSNPTRSFQTGIQICALTWPFPNPLLVISKLLLYGFASVLRICSLLNCLNFQKHHIIFKDSLTWCRIKWWNQFTEKAVVVAVGKQLLFWALCPRQIIPKGLFFVLFMFTGKLKFISNVLLRQQTAHAGQIHQSAITLKALTDKVSNCIIFF